MDTLLSLYLFLACLPKAVVCASRDLPVQAVCVFMWSLLRREGIISKLFCHLLLLRIYRLTFPQYLSVWQSVCEAGKYCLVLVDTDLRI